MLSMVVCADNQTNGIGYRSKLIHNVASDMELFVKETIGKIVLMGKDTFLSLNNKDGLPNRRNIVISKSLSKSQYSDNVTVMSMEEVKQMLIDMKHLHFVVIGGESIYKEFEGMYHMALVNYVEDLTDLKKKKSDRKLDVDFSNMEVVSTVLSFEENHNMLSVRYMKNYDSKTFDEIMKTHITVETCRDIMRNKQLVLDLGDSNKGDN